MREGWGSGRCARACCVPSSRGVYRRGGGACGLRMWCVGTAREEERWSITAGPRTTQCVCVWWGLGGGGWGVGGGECVVRGVCGRGANGLGVCAPVCVRCVGCACGCGGGGLAQRHS